MRDLAEHVPRAYLDWEQVASFGDLSAGEEATVRCTLERIRVRPTRRRNLKLVEGVVVDGEGVRETAVWFNQAYLAKLVPGTELLLHGSRELSGGFRVARTEVRGTGLHTVGLVPEYRASEDVPSYRLRALVDNVLPRARFLPDPLPEKMLFITAGSGITPVMSMLRSIARRDAIVRIHVDSRAGPSGANPASWRNTARKVSCARSSTSARRPPPSTRPSSPNTGP